MGNAMQNCCATPPVDAGANDELLLRRSPRASEAKSVCVKSVPDVFKDSGGDGGEAQEPLAPVQRTSQKCVTKTQGELDKIAQSRGRGHRLAVSAEVMKQDNITNFVKPNYPKTEAERKTITEILQKNEKMPVIAGSLSGDDLNDVVNGFFQKTVTQGHDVIKQGDPGDLLYVCEEGQLEVFVARPDPATGKMLEGKGTKVLTVGPGALFGELALMYSAPRAATITVASSTAKLWALERDAFKMLLVSKSQKQFEAYTGYLKEVDLLKTFNDHELSQIADLMESNLFDEDEEIITQGDPGESFFIVEDGTCEAVMEGKDGEKVVKTYNAGDYFGEIALLTDEPRKATVKATGSGATVLSISREDFANMLGPITQHLKKEIDRYQPYEEFPKSP